MKSHSHKPTTAEVYGYGILANVLCCICSIGGAVILPCAKRYSKGYHVFLSIFLGLAVGTLFTGAIVHLIPEAFGIHSHSHEPISNETNELEEHEHEIHVDPYIWYSLVVLLGTYAFYLLEMIMTLAKYKKGLEKQKQSDGEPVVLTSVGKQNGDFHSMYEERKTKNHEENGKQSENPKKKTGITPLVIMIIVGDAIHNTTDGLVLGAAFTKSLAEGLSLTIAIFCHELPQELGDFAILLNSGMGFCKAAIANLFSSLTAIIGFIIGVQISSNESARGWIFALTAGNFLYIALVDMLPELVKLGSKDIKTFLYHNIGILFGALILVVIAVFEEHIAVKT